MRSEGVRSSLVVRNLDSAKSECEQVRACQEFRVWGIT